MPIYGEAKRRNMTRSILPSKHRKGAKKDRADVHRRARHADSQRIRSWTDDWEDYDESLGARPLGKSWEDELIDNVKWDRRNGDKDAPIMRWGPKVVAHVPIENRISQLKVLLGDNLGGRHALSHLRFLEEIDPNYDRWWERYTCRPSTGPSKDDVAAALRELIVNGRHRWFNNVITADQIVTSRHLRNRVWRTNYVRPRKLLGLHDVPAWVDEAFKHSTVRDLTIRILVNEGVYKLS